MSIDTPGVTRPIAFGIGERKPSAAGSRVLHIGGRQTDPETEGAPPVPRWSRYLCDPGTDAPKRSDEGAWDRWEACPLDRWSVLPPRS